MYCQSLGMQQFRQCSHTVHPLEFENATPKLPDNQRQRRLYPWPTGIVKPSLQPFMMNLGLRQIVVLSSPILIPIIASSMLSYHASLTLVTGFTMGNSLTMK